MYWAAKYTNKDSIRCCDHINFWIHTPYSYLASDVMPSSIFGLHSHFPLYLYKFGPQDKVIKLMFNLLLQIQEESTTLGTSGSMHAHA